MIKHYQVRKQVGQPVQVALGSNVFTQIQPLDVAEQNF